MPRWWWLDMGRHWPTWCLCSQAQLWWKSHPTAFWIRHTETGHTCWAYGTCGGAAVASANLLYPHNLDDRYLEAQGLEPRSEHLWIKLRCRVRVWVMCSVYLDTYILYTHTQRALYLSRRTAAQGCQLWTCTSAVHHGGTIRTSWWMCHG